MDANENKFTENSVKVEKPDQQLSTKIYHEIIRSRTSEFKEITFNSNDIWLPLKKFVEDFRTGFLKSNEKKLVTSWNLHTFLYRSCNESIT